MEQHDYDAIAAIVDYLSDPRESRSISEITAKTGLTKPHAKTALEALKGAAIMKTSGRGNNQKWYLDLSLPLPIELPEHLLPGPKVAMPPAESTETQEDEPGSEDVASSGVEEPVAADISAAADEVDAAPAEPGNDAAAHDEHDAEDRSEGVATETGAINDTESQSMELADSESDTDGPQGETAETDDQLAWTVGGELLEDRKNANRGLIDIEAMSVFHLLPAHDADSGVDMPYLEGMLGAALSTTRIVKALWLMWEHGIAQAKGMWRPDRGEWKLTEGAKLEHLKAFAMANAPRRVTCPDCGHDGALNYKADKGSAVRTFDPDAPAPEGFEQRTGQEGHRRNPVVMFCAMALHYIGMEMTAAQVAEFTGHTEPFVLQALWAMRVCRIVECTDVRRADGGTWTANDATFKRPEWVRLTDAPDALGCATCGQAVGTRATSSGNAGGKATKGVSRSQTHDGGEPLPMGSLPIMIQAWAIRAPGLEPAGEGDDPTVRTPTKLLGDLQSACGSGRMVDWLAAWAESHPQDAAKVGAASEAIAKGGHPRSSGAVKNALFGLKGGGLIEEVRDARVETYRSTVTLEDFEAPFEDADGDEDALVQALLAEDENDEEDEPEETK